MHTMFMSKKRSILLALMLLLALLAACTSSGESAPVATPLPEFPSLENTQQVLTQASDPQEEVPACAQGKLLTSMPFFLDAENNLQPDPNGKVEDVHATGRAILVEGIGNGAPGVYCQGNSGSWYPISTAYVATPEVLNTGDLTFPVGLVEIISQCNGKQAPPPPFTAWIISANGAQRMEENSIPSGTSANGWGTHFDLNRYLCQTDLMGPFEHKLFFLVTVKE